MTTTHVESNIMILYPNLGYIAIPKDGTRLDINFKP